MKTTIFKNFATPLEDKSLIVIINDIIQGKYKDEVENIRLLNATGNSDEADKMKQQLPAFTPSATFNGGIKQKYLVEYSHFIALDVDDLTEEQYTFAFDKVKNCSNTFCCFRSPTGNGLKILIQVSSDKEHHQIAYKQVADFYEALMNVNVKVDPKCKNINRLCFVSYDPDAYKNIGSDIFKIDISKSPEEEAPIAEPLYSEDRNDANLANFAKLYEQQLLFTEKKNSFEGGNRNNFVHQLSCNCNRAGIPQDVALQHIQEKFNYDDKEVRATIRSAYENNKDDFAKFARFAPLQSVKEGQQEELTEQLSNTPFITDEVYSQLPQLLMDGSKVFSDKREKDVFITGALAILSGCFKSITGIYDRRVVYPNLFCFVIAPAASGKSALSFSRQLAKVIHDNILQKSNFLKEQYELAMEQYEATKRNKGKNISTVAALPPQKPKFKVLFIPANSSSAAVLYHINESDGVGIFCETEADTMVNAFKQDWGGYSDMLRKAFHHETISSSRKTDHEYIQIENTRLSVALTGTPSQVLGIISSAEDGLLSRLIFYSFKSKPEWRDVSPSSGVNLTAHFEELSKKVNAIATTMNQTATKFDLTEEQWKRFNKKFDGMLKDVSTFISEDASGSVKRLGLIAFRIAMVLSIIRNGEEGIIETTITCREEDFNSALALTGVYLKHAMLMFESLPKSSLVKLDKRKLKFYKALPADVDFSRAAAVEIGKQLFIAERSVDNYLKELLGTYLEEGAQYGHYKKIR